MKPGTSWPSCISAASGTPRDETKAFEIEKRLAYNGYTQAQALIAAMYHEGIGTDPDLARAYAWAVIAARSGNETYVRLANEYAGEASPTQRSLAGAIIPQIDKQMDSLRKKPEGSGDRTAVTDIR